MDGYISLHRKLLENPVVCKDAEHLAVWVWLLLKATWKESDVLFNGKRIALRPGDLPPISRKTISSELQISESKVQRILKAFENEHQIEQQMGSHSRLISICSWDKYQLVEPQSKPQVNTKRTPTEQQVNTIEKLNKGNKGNKGNKKYIVQQRNIIPPTIDMVSDYIFEQGYQVDAQQFMDFYDSKGWMVGKNKMKDWQAAVRTWSKNKTATRKQTAYVNPFTEMLRNGEW